MNERTATDEVKYAREVKVIEVILCRGKGTDEDIARTVTQWWSVDGTLLGEHDPYKEKP